MADITIADVRKKYPQYDKLSDQDLASNLHKKFYSQLDAAEFNKKIGLAPTTAPTQTGGFTNADALATLQEGVEVKSNRPKPTSLEPAEQPLALPSDVIPADRAAGPPSLGAGPAVSPSLPSTGSPALPADPTGLRSPSPVGPVSDLGAALKGLGAPPPNAPPPIAQQPAPSFGLGGSVDVGQAQQQAQALALQERAAIAAAPPAAPVPVDQGPTIGQDLKAGLLQLQQIPHGISAGAGGLRATAGARQVANPQNQEIVSRLDRQIEGLERELQNTDDPDMREFFQEDLDRAKLKRQEKIAGQAALGQENIDAGLGRIEKAVPKIVELSRRIGELPTNEAADLVGKAETFKDGWEAFKTDPLGAVQSFTFRSLPSSAPTMLSAVVGSLFGGPTTAAALGGGVGAATEFGATIAGEMEGQLTQAGVDITSRDSIKQFMDENPQAFSDMVKKGAIRAGVIGAADAITAGVTGKIAASAARSGKATRAGTAAATGAIIDPVGEGAGEAVAGLVTDGKINPGEVIAEMAGGAGQGAVTTAGQTVAELRKGPDVQATGPVAPETPAAPEPAPVPERTKPRNTTNPVPPAPEAPEADRSPEAASTSPIPPEIPATERALATDLPVVEQSVARPTSDQPPQPDQTAQAIQEISNGTTKNERGSEGAVSGNDADAKRPKDNDSTEAGNAVSNQSDNGSTAGKRDEGRTEKTSAGEQKLIDTTQTAPQEHNLDLGEELAPNTTHQVKGSDGKTYSVEIGTDGDVSSARLIEARTAPHNAAPAPDTDSVIPPAKPQDLFRIEPADVSRRSVSDPEPVNSTRVLSELRTRMNAIGLSDVDLGLLDVSNPDNVAGRFSSDTQTMQILVDTARDPVRTINHEAIHALRAMNLFTPQEWATLEAKAPQWAERFGVSENYPDADPALIAEEAIAEAFAAWKHEKQEPSGIIDTALGKIKKFFMALMEGRMSERVKSEDDLFGKVDSGEIGKRDRELSREIVDRMRKVTGPLADQDQGLLDNLREVYGNRPIHRGITTFRIKFQDAFLPWGALGTEFGVDRNKNPYDHLSLIDSRSGAAMEKIEADYKLPVAEQMGKNQLSNKAVSAYLMLKHIDERDAVIKARFGTDNGSGVSPEAREMLEGEIDKASVKQRAALKEIAVLVKAMHQEAITMREKAGLLSAQQAKSWRTAYPNYVPLRGFDELSADEYTSDGAKKPNGNNVKGEESQEALGRSGMANLDELLGTLFAQVDEAIVRSHKNEVGFQVLQLVLENPDPERWEVLGGKARPILNTDTGQIEYQQSKEQPAKPDDNTVTFKVNGKARMIRFNDPALARAYSKAGFQNLGTITRHARMITGGISGLYTRWSPTFLITNIFRDVTAGMLLARKYRFDHKGIRVDMAKGYAPAAMAIGRNRENLTPDQSEWHRYAEEFHKAGGITAFSQFKDLVKQRQDIEKMAARFDPTIKSQGLRFGKASAQSYFKLLDRLSGATENALRLSLYRALRERGVSSVEAANEAKDITVNFNRRGEWSSFLGSYFMFFNASVQGISTLMRNAKTLGAPFVAMGLLGLVADQLNGMLQDEDKEEYDRLPEYIKQRNLIIPMYGENGLDFIKIPLPYGFSSFANMGRMISAYERKAISSGQAFGQLADEVKQSWSPVGSLSLTTPVPDALDPLVEVAMNHNSFFDGPIVFEKEDKGPLSHQISGTESWGASEAAKALNKITGGSAFKKGLIDLHPKQFDHLLFGYSGSVGRDLGRLGTSADKLIAGIRPDIATQPVFRAVAGRASTQHTVSTAYDAMNDTAGQLEGFLRQVSEFAAQEASITRQTDKRSNKAISETIESALPDELKQFYRENKADLDLGGFNTKLLRHAIKSGVSQGRDFADPMRLNWFTDARVTGGATKFRKAMTTINKKKRAVSLSKTGTNFYKAMLELDNEARDVGDAFLIEYRQANPKGSRVREWLAEK